MCEHIDILDSDSIEAKKLKNHPIYTYMCINCHDKIAKKTKKRMSQGKYRAFKGETPIDII